MVPGMKASGRGRPRWYDPRFVALLVVLMARPRRFGWLRDWSVAVLLTAAWFVGGWWWCAAVGCAVAVVGLVVQGRRFYAALR
jgi:hypothetical protein